MKLKDKNILVTGSDGFIGSHLVEKLVAEGAKVRAFVFYNSFNHWGWLESLPSSTQKELDVFCGDVRDPNGVSEAVKGMDAVFHLAALIGIPFSFHSPDSYVDTNIRGTLNVLQAARRWDVQKVIHTSTSEVYGTAQYVPMNEDHPIAPQSPYAATKAAADQLALSFYRSFALPVAVLRPFNTFGPRQSARAVIPTIISQFFAGNTNIRLGDTTTTRDFTHVADTIDAFYALAQSDEAVGQVFNAGSGLEVCISDLVETIGEVVGQTITCSTEKNRLRPNTSEVERLCSDASRLRDLCGWEPRVTLEEGLRLTCRWMKDNINSYKPEIYNV